MHTTEIFRLVFGWTFLAVISASRIFFRRIFSGQKFGG